MWPQGAGVEGWPQPPEDMRGWEWALGWVVTSLWLLVLPLHLSCPLQTLLPAMPPGDSGSGNSFAFGAEVSCMGCGAQRKAGSSHNPTQS